jgi:hypothetical protein
MNTICREEFEKTKELIRVRKDKMNYSVKPDVQNLDSGILLQFFENWDNQVGIAGEFTDEELQFKQRPFNILNNENIEEIFMYYVSDTQTKKFDIEHDSIFINLDGSFDFTCDGETTTMTPFSVTTYKKGCSMRVENCEDINYFIAVRLKSPLF